MSDMPENIRDAGDDKSDAEVSKRTKRNRTADGTFPDEKKRTKSYWPFKHSLEDNRWYVNRSRRRVKADENFDNALL